MTKNPDSVRAMFGKAQVMDKMAEQKRSNALLEEYISLATKVMHMVDIPADLLRQVAERLADRQQFRGQLTTCYCSSYYLQEYLL